MAEPRIQIPAETIAAFCRKWKVQELALFGSVLRTDFRPDSDVDVLVTFASDAPWSLYDWIEMGEELQRILGRRVDLVSSAGLRNPIRRRRILSTREIVYAA